MISEHFSDSILEQCAASSVAKSICLAMWLSQRVIKTKMKSSSSANDLVSNKSLLRNSAMPCEALVVMPQIHSHQSPIFQTSNIYIYRENAPYFMSGPTGVPD